LQHQPICNTKIRILPPQWDFLGLKHLTIGHLTPVEKMAELKKVA
jgi:hypothetical protein